MRELLDEGVDINAKLVCIGTPLINACKRCHVEIVALLLDRGALSDVNDYFYTPLIWACRKGHVEIVTLLLDNGAIIDWHGRFRTTALIHACEKGHVEIATLLLDRDALVNEKNSKTCNTALHYAAQRDNMDLCELLISRGADLLALNWLNRKLSIFRVPCHNHIDNDKKQSVIKNQWSQFQHFYQEVRISPSTG